MTTPDQSRHDQLRAALQVITNDDQSRDDQLRAALHVITSATGETHAGTVATALNVTLPAALRLLDTLTTQGHIIQLNPRSRRTTFTPATPPHADPANIRPELTPRILAHLARGRQTEAGLAAALGQPREHITATCLHLHHTGHLIITRVGACRLFAPAPTLVTRLDPDAARRATTTPEASLHDHLQAIRRTDKAREDRKATTPRAVKEDQEGRKATAPRAVKEPREPKATKEARKATAPREPKAPKAATTPRASRPAREPRGGTPASQAAPVSLAPRARPRAVTLTAPTGQPPLACITTHAGRRGGTQAFEYTVHWHAPTARLAVPITARPGYPTLATDLLIHRLLPRGHRTRTRVLQVAQQFGLTPGQVQLALRRLPVQPPT